MHRLSTVSILAITFVLSTTAALAQPIPARPLLPHDAQSLAAARAGTAAGNPFLLIDYPGAIANQYPSGINDKGKMVGYAIFADGSIKGYLLQGTSFKDVVFPGAAVTAGSSINKSGLIIGQYCIDAECDTSHGFSLKGKTYASIDFPGGENTGPYGVNASGDIVGIYGGSDHPHGFLLHKGAYTSIDVPAAILTYAFGINKQGTIVGSFASPDNVGHGFILQNGTFTQVDYPGADRTELTCINDSGDIIGVYDDAQTHGFLLRGGVFTPLDAPFPGTTTTVPFGLNNNHQIVGYYGSYQPDYFFGFLTSY